MVMLKKFLAFIYNVRHEYPDPHDPQTYLEADFDDQATIDVMIRHFTAAGYRVLPVEANLKAEAKLKQYQSEISLAFNYSEIIVGDPRRRQITAVLDRLKILYTGSGNEAQKNIRDKAKAKTLLQQQGVPVAPGQVFKTGTEKLNRDLVFPLIIKPCSQGSSAGITDSSVVNSQTELYAKIQENIKLFRDKVLAEQFLTGREFSVAMVGNPPRILPIIEPDFSHLPKKFKPLDSYEVKWIFEEAVSGQNHLICPAKIDHLLKQKIKATALKVWQALKINDWCRIDMRCDEKGNLYVLEINSPAGLLPPEVSLTSYLPLSARAAGWDYQKLLKHIIKAAEKRK